MGKECAMAFIIALLMNGLLFDNNWMAMGCLFAVYFFSAVTLSWIVYHEKAKIRLAARITAAAVLSIFLLPVPYKGILLTAIAVVTTICAFNIHLDIEKYYHDMSRFDASNAASSQNNYAQMSRLAEENRPQSVRGITYGQLHPTRQNAIFLYRTL